jgi:uncharacterized membrane protein YfcA
MHSPELFISIFLIAALYSAVGHGGASGYLAVLALINVNPNMAVSTALLLNILVSALALISYIRAKHFSMRLTEPFLLASVLCAFLGATLKIADPFYHLLLGIVLLASATIMALPKVQSKMGQNLAPVKPSIAFIAGGILGLISGMVGVGGGIFLSPLMILSRWATPKTTSATAAAFILANSLAGFGGRLLQGRLVILPFWSLLLAGILGGWLGSNYGARWASNPVLCRLLALVMAIAAMKMLSPGN